MRAGLTVPYDVFTNKPDPNSEDFKDVMAWLATYGVKAPTISYYVLSSGGFQSPIAGQNPGPMLQLTFPGYISPMDGALVLNFPGVVIQLLGLDGGNVPNYTPPAPPPPPPPGPPTQPANPIGAYDYTDTLGHKIYFAATGDVLPNGTLWPPNATATDPLYLKESWPSMFGSPYQDWKQLR